VPELEPSTEVRYSVSQPPGRGPVPGPGINYTGPREVLLEFVILVFYAFFMNKYFIVEILRRIIFVNVSKSSDPERLNIICVANVSDQVAYF
jgi:hypothetical protein